MKNPGVKPGDVVTVVTLVTRTPHTAIVKRIDWPNQYCFLADNGDSYSYSRIIERPEVGEETTK